LYFYLFKLVISEEIKIKNAEEQEKSLNHINNAKGEIILRRKRKSKFQKENIAFS